MADWPVYARIDGPIVMIGFGSIGKGALPLIERHFTYDKSRFVVIDPEDKDRHLLDERGIRFIHEGLPGQTTSSCSLPCSRPAAVGVSASICRSIRPRSSSCRCAARSARSTSIR